jgi:cell fate regulator YaaT (PSP1 superfamily)
MPTIVGVRLRFSKTLWFDPLDTTPAEGDLVIVETERGTEVGTVVQPPHEVAAETLPAALKPVVRVADEADLARVAELEAKEREAFPVFRGLVESYELDMKPIDVEYVFDGDKIVFYFSAEERVDFRGLVKDLASQLHARIDMRQVGVRDEARAVGGVGHCGQVLCCVRFGGDFQPVSIRMAKEQDLPLNPLKISGLCGRLMCCLRYEFDAYKDFKGRAPKKGAIIDTAVGAAKVLEFNTPRETVTMRFEDGNRVTVPLGEMTCSKGSGCPCSVGREALEAAGNTVALAMAAEENAAAELAAEPTLVKEREPVQKREQGARREQGPKRDRGPAESATPVEAGSSEGGRRRRRRGGSKPAAEAPAGGEKRAEAAPAEPAPAAGEPSDDADRPSTGRRRRRRRRSGGSGPGAG